jgi:hypothetical protein
MNRSLHFWTSGVIGKGIQGITRLPERILAFRQGMTFSSVEEAAVTVIASHYYFATFFKASATSELAGAG